MDKHITVVGALYIAFSILGIIMASLFFLVVVGSGIISGDPDAMAILSVIGTVLSLFGLITALPGIIGGFGLLKRRNWARILIIILGCLNLINIPFGTCLGGYTLWVLLNKESEALFT